LNIQYILRHTYCCSSPKYCVKVTHIVLCYSSVEQ